MKLTNSIAIMALTTAFASADIEKEVRLGDCPEPVRKTLEANAREGRIDEIEMISIADKQIYIGEVDLPEDIDLKIFVNGDGSLMKTREDVRGAAIPQFVTNAVKEMGGMADDVEKEIAGKDVIYHVDVELTGKPDLEVVFDSEGNVVSKTEEIED